MITRTGRALGAALALVCASLVAPPAAPAHGTNAATERVLDGVRAATARYHDIDQALADGYADINVVLPNMGHHFLKADLLDATFEADRPEILVYELDPQGGCYRLVAVEYAVPLSLAETAPKGFKGKADHWHRNEEFQLWTLHAWVWMWNPDGVFNATNALVP